MRCSRLFLVAASMLTVIGAARADETASLRLVPFPKHIELQGGMFSLKGTLVLEAPEAAADILGRLIGEELRRAGLPAPKVRSIPGDALVVRLSPAAGQPAPNPTFREGATPEDYLLDVTPEGVVCAAPCKTGLLHGLQTLRQLIRANRRGNALPCLSIRDWPSLRWRCFQDDMTRGPSARLDTLRREIDLGAELKMNLFTYYMEYQFAFQKHPAIGPEDGSLTAGELKALVAHAKPLGVGVLGNQQSFAHFTNILSHLEYAGCRETEYMLSPVKAESYKLLDDLYGEVAPLLPFPWLNVCCDETEGLGSGPSKELAAKIGVGGVYVRHVRRLHDLLRDKYGKRMMIWGDIILKHPHQLDQIPKDTIMLTWGYSPRDNFEDRIVPFAESGYEFFVCPGISNWCRILPDFQAATVNIQNFVRDGAKHGASGTIITEWKDDGENVRGYNWHGYAWGAECAWNDSKTKPEDFNCRIGAVLFGEKGDHFGRAVQLLAKLHRMPVTGGMNNLRFWKDDFGPRDGEPAIRAAAKQMLDVVAPAIEHLEACRKEATVNSELLDSFLLGARRTELIARRMLDGVEAGHAYSEAIRTAEKNKKLAKLAVAERIVRRNRDAHEALGKEFARIWLAESKPYALDWTMKRYADKVKWFDDLASKLTDARRKAEAGRPLPSPAEMGLAFPASK